jgi:outer membrane biogenesis lipoprotein LolB
MKKHLLALLSVGLLVALLPGCSCSMSKEEPKEQKYFEQEQQDPENWE